jgi:hypothetical protein
MRTARTVGAVLVASAGVVWICALFVPLTAYGTGSVQPSHELADLALSGVADASVSRWVGLLWYCTGLVGCLVLGGCTTIRTSVTTIRMIAATMATALAVYAGLDLGRTISDGFGPAVWLSVIAWVSCSAGTYLVRRGQNLPPPLVFAPAIPIRSAIPVTGQDVVR